MILALLTEVDHIHNHGLSARVQALNLRKLVQILHVHTHLAFIAFIVNCFANFADHF